MRLLSTAVAALALTALAIAPASACSWGKSAKAKQTTVADTTVVPDLDTDISIATNDIGDDVLEDIIVLPVPADKPAE
ncbi:MAG: hypothetical protein K5905_03325 [Roseibium sp.]|uniref:hypothetical protein n=1 Tax=Roseibium sp. TaxID=1936156 RepID=UPI00261ACBD8|nr:hypothetical protein [Roseibium sp.]MCV0424480.1 hypothetical protein [Roseibium sp.]